MVSPHHRSGHVIVGVVEPNALNFILLTVCGWVNRRQLAAIDYLRTESQLLREQLGYKKLLLTDSQRRRLAVKGKALGRRALTELCSIVRPATILGWYQKPIAMKYDGSAKRGRPRPQADKLGSPAEGHLVFEPGDNGLRMHSRQWGIGEYRRFWCRDCPLGVHKRP